MTDREREPLDDYGARIGRELYELGGRATEPYDAVAIARSVALDQRRATRSGVVGGWTAARRLPLLLTIGLLAGALLAAIAGGFLSAGGSPVPAPVTRIYTSTTPWSFGQPADVCPEGTAEALPAGPLPQVGPPVIEHPRNGLIATFDTTLVDPSTGAVLTTHLPGDPLILGDSWSPDGRWLAIGWGGDPAAGLPACRDIYLLSSDGTRLANVTGYAGSDVAIDVAWSPDAKWLAISRWVAVAAGGVGGGVAIDVLGIGPDGSVLDARRLWTDGAGDAGALGWSNRGSLSWTSSPNGGPSPGLLMLRPGQTEPDAIIDLGGLGLQNPRWSADGQELVAVTNSGSLYAITPTTGTVRGIDVAVKPVGGKYTWDAQIPTSSDGRLYYPASNGSIYSANLDGTDVRNLTSVPADAGSAQSSDAVLSPDESYVAFRREDSVWLVDADGQGAARRLGTSSGGISWQPVP